MRGVVAMAATETGVVYEAVFGSRRIHEGRVMTRDTIFRVALMVKLITTVAAAPCLPTKNCWIRAGRLMSRPFRKKNFGFSGVYRLYGLAPESEFEPGVINRVCGADRTGTLYIAWTKPHLTASTT
jgi:hypothetical protein